MFRFRNKRVKRPRSRLFSLILMAFSTRFPGTRTNAPSPLNEKPSSLCLEAPRRLPNWQPSFPNCVKVVLSHCLQSLHSFQYCARRAPETTMTSRFSHEEAARKVRVIANSSRVKKHHGGNKHDTTSCCSLDIAWSLGERRPGVPSNLISCSTGSAQGDDCGDPG